MVTREYHMNMVFFDVKYMLLFSLFVSSVKLSDAESTVNNVIHEEKQFSKILNKFWKVPWINLNSTWQNEVTSTCRHDIKTLFESADVGETWALKMLDATSRLPPGLLVGNIRELGIYDECVQVKPDDNSANIQGRHCMVSMAMPTKFVSDPTEILHLQKQSAYNPTANVDLNFAATLCFPSSCDVDDIAGFVNASIRSTQELVELEVRVARVTCSRIDSEVEIFTFGAILTVSLLAMHIVFLIFCTVCDFVVKSKPEVTSPTLQTLAKFSLYTNAIKLWNTEISPGTMPALNGIRFLSMLMIVTGHRILGMMTKPSANQTQMPVLWQSWIAPMYHILPHAVDTFLIFSGFLAAHYFLNKLRSGSKFNVLQVYIHRYLRLAPCLAFVIAFTIYISPHIGSGPLWETIIGLSRDHCRKNWWINILHIQNFVNPMEMCLPQTWYLAVEMQLFWLCPIILYPLFYRPKLSVGLLSVLVIVSCVISAIQVGSNQYSSIFNMYKTFQERHEIFCDSYIVTYNRVMPYLIGIILAYDMVNKKRAFTKLQASFGWVLACFFLAFCFWNATIIQPISPDYNAIAEASYASFSRLLWSLAMAWIIYACTQGHGGPITKILSLPIFVPLAKLGYTIYLVSVMIQIGYNALIRTSDTNSILTLLYMVPSDLVISIIIASTLSLTIETPVLVLEKILSNKQSHPAVVKDASAFKIADLRTTVREYLNLKDEGVESNAKIASVMLQPEFWRSMCALLLTSFKQRSKTSVECGRVPNLAWWDWKSDFTRKFYNIETRRREIQDSSTRSKIGITELETELMTCVTVLLKLAKSGAAESSESLRVSSISHDEAIAQSITPDSSGISKKKMS